MIAASMTARPGHPLKGVIRAPGDKSISHRALILGALANGVTTAQGLLEGDDVLRTAQAMRAPGGSRAAAAFRSRRTSSTAATPAPACG